MPEKTDSEASDVLPPFGFEAMMQMQRPAFTAVAELNGRLYESGILYSFVSGGRGCRFERGVYVGHH